MNQEQIDDLKRKYRSFAPTYDDKARVPEWLRKLAVERLELQPGETVLDVGCGTGRSFEYLEPYIGPEGRIIGVDLSPEMLAVARRKAEHYGWANVTLMEGNAERLEVSEPVDAVLSFFVPQMMHSTRSVRLALRALKPGGWFVACGAKRAEGIRGFPANLRFMVEYRTWRFMTIGQSLNRLWRSEQPYVKLESMVGRMERTDYMDGTAYIARVAKPTY